MLANRKKRNIGTGRQERGARMSGIGRDVGKLPNVTGSFPIEILRFAERL
jgi:hypothetical protein